MCCGVCGAVRPLACPKCFAASSCLPDWRSLLQQRDAVSQQLAAVLAVKVAHQQRQLQLLHLDQALGVTQQRANQVDCTLQVQHWCILLARQQLQHRQHRLSEVQQDLAALSRQAEALAAPHRSPQVLACVHSLEELALEHRIQVVSRAMEVLPFNMLPYTGPDVRTGSLSPASPQHSTAVCSLTLPDRPADMAEVAGSLGSALGYLALLLDLLARFLQLPIAHRATFQGSTSRFWQPDGFFDVRATPPNDALRLQWPAAADSAPSGLGLSTLGGCGSAAVATQQQHRRDRQLQAALHELQRSAGLLVYARLGPEAALNVPEDRLPFAWLANLCRLLAMESRSGSACGGLPGLHILQASTALGRSPVSAGGGSPSPNVWLRQGAKCPAEEVADGAAVEETEVYEEDWEHLPWTAFGMMPPRPWELEDLEHWEQANYADGGGVAANGGSSPITALQAWFNHARTSNAT